MIGLHAERVAGDDRAVRWVVPPGLLPVGRVLTAPGRLGEMLCAGVFSAALTENSAVWLWLRDGLSWAQSGVAVQSALRAALDTPDDWSIRPAPAEVLGHVTADLLAGPVGDFIRSHGGSVRTQPTGSDAVTVTLGGACQHCPAAGHTLRLRLLGELRRRCPNLVEVDRGDGGLTLTLSS